MQNHMRLKMKSCPENESFARTVVAAFAVQLDPTVGEMEDIKTAVSEAVTNAIVHGYHNGPGEIEIAVTIREENIWITVGDKGCGIPDIEQAMEPFFTTEPDQERSGMGFTVMKLFMDKLDVESIPGEGTRVTMSKLLTKQIEDEAEQQESVL